MTWLPMENVAQISAERLLNALPEGLLIALIAWALLHALRRQNSGTRFAVWFAALLSVAALPVLGGFNSASASLASPGSWGHLRPAITIPEYWASFLFLTWAVGASVGIIRLAVGLWRLRQLRLSCTPITTEDSEFDPALRQMLDTICGSSGDAITIATSERLRVPSAIGFWKRTVVLPAWTLRELSPSDLRVILLHEIAHLRRWDDWTNLIQKVVRALFFFHPAVWWIEGRLSEEREMACDDAVLAATENPHGYASCLVSLLEKSAAHRLTNRPWSMAQAAVNRAREASLRLARILDKNRPVATRVWTPALAMAGVFSVACLMALVHAPQIVAFDRNSVGPQSARAYSAAAENVSAQQAMHSAAIIPAAFHVGDTVAHDAARAGARTTIRSSKGIPARAIRRRSVPRPNVAVAQMNAPLSQLIAASAPLNADEDRDIAPEFQTLVFVETTQFIISDASVWRVQLWRITLKGTIQRIGIVPVAHSI
ncbi:MAG TPA: M56 family metallopeptidase [Terriglobales bacterium]|nr:M56 family metallopeptidase [Terriglobales bacterium]